MARRPSLALLLAPLLVAGGCLGAAGEPVDETLDDLPGLDDGGRADGFGEGETSPEMQAILDRIRARLQEIRPFKEDLVVGETHDGLLAIVDEGAAQLADPLSADRARSLVATENADRLAFYELVLQGYENQLREDIRRQVAEQEPDLRRQVVDQLCDQLPYGEPCSAIADEVIETALREAMDVAIEGAVQGAMIEITAQVRAMYAEFWQDRTSRPGEWVEVEVAPDVYEWRAK